jgi:hypothetical protein
LTIFETPCRRFKSDPFVEVEPSQKSVSEMVLATPIPITMSHENGVELRPVGQRVGYSQVSTVAETPDPRMVAQV